MFVRLKGCFRLFVTTNWNANCCKPLIVNTKTLFSVNRRQSSVSCSCRRLNTDPTNSGNELGQINHAIDINSWTYVAGIVYVWCLHKNCQNSYNTLRGITQTSRKTQVDNATCVLKMHKARKHPQTRRQRRHSTLRFSFGNFEQL